MVQTLPWLILLASLAGTLAMWVNSREHAGEDLQSTFNFRVREATTRIERRMRTYEQVLRGTKGLFNASNRVNRTQFHTYAAALRLEENYPGILGLGFASCVRGEDKSRHVIAIRNEGFPEYTINPEGNRSVYTPVTFLEPFSGRNLRAFGYDMYSEPVRHAAMEESQDFGRTSISGKITLVQETERGQQAGFLMYLPVYIAGMPTNTLEERRINTLGWAFASFRAGDLLSGLQGEQSEDLHIQVYDGMDTAQAGLMFDSDSTCANVQDKPFTSVSDILVAGHHWTACITSTPSFAERFDQHNPHIFAVIGVGASLLLSLLTWLLVNGQARAVRIAEDRETRYQQLLQQASDGIILLDRDWRILEANRQAVAHFGYAMDELLRMRAEELYPAEYREDLHSRCGILDIEGSARFASMHLRKDGSRTPVEVSLREVQFGESSFILMYFQDITERLNAERSLHESESRFRALFEKSPDAIFISDPETFTILDCNPKACAMNGFSRDELVGQSINMLHPAETASTLEDPAAKRIRIENLRRGGEITVEGVHRRKDGTQFPIESSISLITLGGKLVTMGIDRDITERKVMESALRRGEQRYRGVVNGIREVAFETDARGVWTFLNPAWTEITGFSVEDSLGKVFLDYVYPDDRERNIELFRPLIERHKDHCRHEIRYRTKEGGFRWIEVHARLMLDDKGNAVGTTGTLRDITDQKKRQAESEAREELAMSFFTNQAAITLLIDPEDGSIVDANAAASEFYGYAPDVLRAMKIFDINIFSHETVIAAMKQASTERRMHYILPHKLSNGEIREVEIYSSGFDFRGKRLLSSIIHDVTEKRRIERELETSLKEKEVLVREVHHRVKNNLNVVASLLSMQSRYAKVKDDVRLFEEARDRILAMAYVHEKLYRSKGLTQVDVRSYVEEIIRGLGGVYRNGNVTVRLDIPTVNLGPDKAIPVGLILNELVTNCYKYAFPDGREGVITIAAQRTDDYHLCLQVSDDGVGLAPDINVERSESLGLNLVSMLSKQLDGRLEVTRGNGTCFCITFPIG